MRNGSELRSVVEAGVVFGLVGFFFGLALFTYFVRYLDVPASADFLIIPAVSLLLLGTLLWWLVVVKKKQKHSRGGNHCRNCDRASFAACIPFPCCYQ